MEFLQCKCRRVDYHNQRRKVTTDKHDSHKFNKNEMKVTVEKNEKVANMIFASIYPLYLNRLEKNGRTKEELDQVINWFTGFDQDALQALIDEKATFRTFFQKAKIHPNAHMIKGVVCGYRIEEIADEFDVYKQCRRMEKLIDELARGRKMEKILREEKTIANKGRN